MKHAALAIFAALLSSAPAVLVASPSGVDARVEHGSGLASKKATAVAVDVAPAPEPLPLLATLVQTHTDERVPLDDALPTPERFAALLADRVTGERHAFDPRLLELLRALARSHPGARIELVSGYRSAKLNEAMRKKGHHVASHSQHSLGHACDFRIVLPGEPRGLDPRTLEKEIRDQGWTGGVGVYPLSSDWFVHADVGPLRRWTSN
ncbi:MAG: putative exported protein [Myxococcaceae bacterium]|nr:putative exported protein [Myxococcaceae bacterium]